MFGIVTALFLIVCQDRTVLYLCSKTPTLVIIGWFTVALDCLLCSFASHSGQTDQSHLIWLWKKIIFICICAVNIEIYMIRASGEIWLFQILQPLPLTH